MVCSTGAHNSWFSVMPGRLFPRNPRKYATLALSPREEVTVPTLIMMPPHEGIAHPPNGRSLCLMLSNSFGAAPTGTLPGFFRERRVCELRRITLLRRWVNKGHHVRLRLLVNDEHALAKLVRCSPEAAFGAQILRYKLCELLVCG